MRTAVALLLAANLLFYAWTQGWLASVAGAPRIEREPERLQAQVHPEAVQLLGRQAAAAALAAASAPPAAPVCLEAGPFDEPQLAAAEAALREAGVPSGRWQATLLERAGVWLVYMGKFPDRETLDRKAAELDRIRIAHETLSQPPELAPGLALGRYDDRRAADAALAQLTQRGVRTARVVQTQAPAALHLLRVDPAEAALAEQLRALKAPALAAGFRSCGGA